MKFMTIFVLFVATMFFSAPATYRDYLQKKITIPLPYYPDLFKFKGTEVDVNLYRMPNAANFYCGSSHEGEKGKSFAYGIIENNPAKGVVRIHEPRGIAFESAHVNNELVSVNPLFDAPLLHFSSAMEHPTLVTKKNPTILLSIDSSLTDTNQRLIASEPLKDSQGNDALSIIGLAFASTGTLEFISNPYIFAAIEEQHEFSPEGNVGAIAVIKDVKKEEDIVTVGADGQEKKERKIDHFFDVLDASTGTSRGNKAVAINKSILTINGGPGFSEAKIVDIAWSNIVERLFVALQVKNSSACDSNQGCKALLVGRLDCQERLVFDPINADEFLQGNDKIVGACGSDVATSLHKVRTLLTTTGIAYLIIVGDVGEPDETNKKVFALPLADKNIFLKRAELMEDASHGTLVSKNSDMRTYREQTVYGNKLVATNLPIKPTHSDDVLTNNDKQTQVGAGMPLPSAVTDLILEGDAVFVTCAQPGNGQQPGIFHSQAILDHQGKIAAWTPWQRIAGIQEGVAKAFINIEQYFIAYVPSERPEIVCQITQNISPNKERENAEKEKGDLADLLKDEFKRELGGIQGLFDFSASNPLCGNSNLVSFMVATGYKKIVLVETGRSNEENIFTGFKEGFTTNIITSKDGTVLPVTALNDEQKPTVLSIEGGALDELGAISEAVSITDGQQAWLVVAGMRGIAILMASDGSGIKCTEGILPCFAGIQKPLSFKKIGNWSGIKKIVADEEFLYVLTKNKLERVSLHQQALQENIFQNCCVLAEANQQECSFFDVGVSGPLVLITTSRGLLVNGAGTDCRYHGSMEWQKISLPKAKGNVYKLFFVSSDGQKNGFGHGGQLYVLTGSLLENMTRVYRLYIADVFKSGVMADSVKLIQYEDNDFYNIGFKPLLTFGNYRDHFSTNGAHYFSARSRQVKEKPFMQLSTLPHIRNKNLFEPVAFSIPINIGKKTKNVSALVQNSATGNWLLAGDFGLKIHN